MTREALLKASIKEFEDNIKNANVYKCKRIYTDSGYVYLIKDKHTKKSISCAIHWNASFEVNENIGKYESNDVSINTREKLDFDCIIEYNDLLIALTSQDDYNATMGQWHYFGTAAFSPISDRFFITSEEEIELNIGINSLSYLLPLDLGFPLVPSYYSAQNKKQYIMIDIEESISLTPVYQKGDELVQYKQDSVRFAFVNLDTYEAMSCIKKLQDYSLQPDVYGFALNDNLNLRDENVYQKSFNWKSLTYVSDFKINYYLKAKTPEIQMVIKQALFSAFQTL